MENRIKQRVTERLGGELAKLAALGITEHAIITYVRRLDAGHSKELALAGVLRGRSLDADQVAYAQSMLDLLSVGAKGAGG